MSETLGKAKDTYREPDSAPKGAGFIALPSGHAASWRAAITERISRYMGLALEVDEHILK
jgi:hypothetical protein